jgi:hypothetical protein
MQSTSKSSLLIYTILALFLFSWLWAFFNYDEPVRYIRPISVKTNERIIEREKLVRDTLFKRINHFDTIYLDTFKPSAEGLKKAIGLHIHLDTTL